MGNYAEYWAGNTFEMNERVNRFKAALKPAVTKGVTYTRIGSVLDGGYVLADDITDQDHVVSFGVEGNVDFEKEISKYGCHIDMYDYSVDGPPEEVPNSIFFKEKIGLESEGNTPIGYCLGKTAKDIILKMDIESSEWNILALDYADLNKCRQIIIEYHWTQYLTDMASYTTAVSAVENIRKTHTPVMVHANNNVPLFVLGNSPMPMVFEVLYLRNSSYTFEESVDPFKGLITRNDPNFPEIGLSFP